MSMIQPSGDALATALVIAHDLINSRSESAHKLLSAKEKAEQIAELAGILLKSATPSQPPAKP